MMVLALRGGTRMDVGILTQTSSRTGNHMLTSNPRCTGLDPNPANHLLPLPTPGTIRGPLITPSKGQCTTPLCETASANASIVIVVSIVITTGSVDAATS